MATSSHGDAGGEARRKYESLSAKRQKLNRERNGLQKTLAFLLDVDKKAIQQEDAWKKGAKGEEIIGSILDSIATKKSFVAIHDRAIPRSQANIDHMLVTPFGVFVIDAKNYRGMIRIEDGGLLDFNAKPTLYVGKRNQTILINKVKKQVEIVEKALTAAKLKLPVYGALAFTEAEFPLLFKPKEVDGVLVNSRGIEAAVESKAGEALAEVDAVTEILLKAFKAK